MLLLPPVTIKERSLNLQKPQNAQRTHFRPSAVSMHLTPRACLFARLPEKPWISHVNLFGHLH